MADVYIKLPKLNANEIASGIISNTEFEYLNGLTQNIAGKFLTLDQQITELGNFYKVLVATTTSGQEISNETDTIIVWDTVIHDPGSCLNTSTGAWQIAAMAGTFVVVFTFHFSSTNSKEFDFNTFIKGTIFSSGDGIIARDTIYFTDLPDGDTELGPNMTVIGLFYTDSGGIEICTKVMQNCGMDVNLATESQHCRVAMYRVGN